MIRRNDTRIDIEIKTLLVRNRFVRKRDLIKQLKEKFDLSKITIERKIKNALERKEIAKIYVNDFNRYGINEVNKNAVYITLNQTLELNKYITAIFDLLVTNDLSDIKLGARELLQYDTSHFGQNFLDIEQLDVLVNVLDKSISDSNFKDDELRYTLVSIIFNEISTKRIKPSDKEEFISTLKQLLHEYPTNDFYNKSFNLIPNLIYLLGIYMNDAVIERLNYDALNCSNEVLRNIEPYYSHMFTSKIIENSRIKLLKLVGELQKANKKEALQFVENIRRNAAYNMNNIETNPYYIELFEVE